MTGISDERPCSGTLVRIWGSAPGIFGRHYGLIRTDGGEEIGARELRLDESPQFAAFGSALVEMVDLRLQRARKKRAIACGVGVWFAFFVLSGMAGMSLVGSVVGSIIPGALAWAVLSDEKR